MVGGVAIGLSFLYEIGNAAVSLEGKRIMLRAHHHYVVSLLSLALVTCSKPALNVTAARNSMVGMNTEQITSCMGRPGTALTQDNTTVWSYDTFGGTGGPPILVDPTSLSSQNAPQSGGPLSGSFASAMGPPPRASCTVTVIFNQGQVDGLNFLGPNGAQLSQSDECGQLVQQCIHVTRTGKRTP